MSEIAAKDVFVNAPADVAPTDVASVVRRCNPRVFFQNITETSNYTRGKLKENMN